MFKFAIAALALAATLSFAPAAVAKNDDVVSVVCIENTNPRWVAVYVDDIQVLTLPYAIYPDYAAEYGLPGIVCD